MYNLKRIAGKKGKTVCYTLQNLEITEGTSINIKWDSWRFYSPEGNLTEPETDFKYFEVQALNEVITRESIDKEILIAVKYETESTINVIERYLGSIEEIPFTLNGMEGDIVLTGIIPADPEQEIQVEYKEVYNRD